MKNGWVPIGVAARFTHRSVRTLRTWVWRGQVSASCHVATRRLMVWMPDVLHKTTKAEHRAPRHRRAA